MSAERMLNNGSFVIGFWIKILNVTQTTKIFMNALHVFNDEELKIVELFLDTNKKIMSLVLKNNVIGYLR